ncbi:transposable element Tc1 transposase [Trichonephila clavipes]|nr:transposable element Tc1 transposase [Trichonephila clavipes]
MFATPFPQEVMSNFSSDDSPINSPEMIYICNCFIGGNHIRWIRRHFTQISEFEIGLIIGKKTAGWSTRRVAGQVDRSECAFRNCWEQWTREGTHARKTGSGGTRKTTRREDRRIVRQALVDPTVTRSTILSDVGVAIVPQLIYRHIAEANLKSKRPFRALPLRPEHRQLRLQWCQARSLWNVTDWGKRLCLVMNPGLFWGQMITVYGCGGALVSGPFLNGLPGTIFQQDNARPHTARVAQDFLRHFQTLKRQMPSCHCT